MVIPVIGVDFGDCTTIMSFIDEYDPVNRMSGVVHNLVPLRFWDGIPNVYYYSRKVGKTLCGQEAISSKAKPEQNRLRNLRRHLGEKIQIDDRIIFYDDAITEVIEHCIRVANKCLEAGWHVSTNLVSLSYPATYTFAQRQRLIELVEKATLEDGRNIKVVGTIADPAAAALDYLAEFANKDIDTTTVLTYDLGGGTFDLGLVSVYPKGRKGRDGNTYYYDIINTSGIPDLGGAEFDEVMFQLVSSKIRIISVFDLADIIIQSGRDGLTISGGEPFLQAQALYELVNLIRAKRDIGIIVYTGYTLDEILQSKDLYMCRFLEQIDLLIDGPYIEELNDGMNLRGSSNQRAIALTARYESDVDGYGSKKAEVEFFMKEDKVLMVGVPDSNTLNRFKYAFKEETIDE